MKIPGFTAENTLYAAAGYPTVRVRQAGIGSTRVYAQITPGTLLGGPPRVQCPRSCGPCMPDPIRGTVGRNSVLPRTAFHTPKVASHRPHHPRKRGRQLALDLAP